MGFKILPDPKHKHTHCPVVVLSLSMTQHLLWPPQRHKASRLRAAWFQRRFRCLRMLTQRFNLRLRHELYHLTQKPYQIIRLYLAIPLLAIYPLHFHGVATDLCAGQGFPHDVSDGSRRFPVHLTVRSIASSQKG